MSDRAFVDSNVLVYAHDRGAGRKHEQARELVRRLWIDEVGCLSTQIVQEFYLNVRRKARNPVSLDESRRLVEDYLQWHLVVNDGDSVRGALEFEERYKISFWDALVLQAAQASGAPVIYSEDLSDGQIYDRVQVVNPFAG